MKKPALALLAALFACPAAAQVLPSNLPQIELPGNSVIGNSSPVAGNANAIPFAVLTPQLLGAISGDLTCSVATQSCTIANGAVTGAKTANGTITGSNIAANTVANSNLATVPANTVKGSIAGGTPVDLTQAQLTSLCNVVTGALSGCVSAFPSNITTFYRGDGTYSTLFSGYCAPNIQAFTTAGGPNTYTTPTCNGNLPVDIHVMMVGAGGGAGGTGTGGGNGTAGGNTTFGASFAANGGANGINNPSIGTFPAGGTATACQIPVQGQNGSFDSASGDSKAAPGGNSFYSGAGQVGFYTGAGGTFTGDAAKTNSGSGGAVGGVSASVVNASSGAAGGYCEGWITSSIAASYSYTVGAKGSGGAAGTTGSAGGNGADGRITVEARFQ